jgi:hypothetical protein
MDENGNVNDQGTIEEWWAAPNKKQKCKLNKTKGNRRVPVSYPEGRQLRWGTEKNRVTYTLTGISQTFYQSEHGRFRSGSGGVVPELAVGAQNEFASPLPAPEFLQHQTFDEQDQDSGNTKLVCLTVNFPRAPNATATQMGPLYCMDADKLILRLIAIGLSQTIGNKIATFQRRYVPLDIKI